MFSTSSHRHNWLFGGEAALTDIRKEANALYVEHGAADGDSGGAAAAVDPRAALSAEDEAQVRLYYEMRLVQFCRDFRFQKMDISIPLYVQYTAMAYLKRFYLCASVMDFHPADIYLVCIYVACKTDEFNISMPDFEENLARHFDFDPESPDDCAAVQDLSKMVLCFELILMAKLNYDLIVHAPLKPLEGFLLDIRARFPQFGPAAESVKAAALRYLSMSMLSDAMLVFAPAQLALAALSAAADKDAVRRYVDTVLGAGAPEADVAGLHKAVQGADDMVRASRAEWAFSFIERNEAAMDVDTSFTAWVDSTVDGLLERLRTCRNPANDYLTEQFSKRFNDTRFSDDD